MYKHIHQTKPRHNAVYQFHMALETQTNTDAKQTLQTQDTSKLKTLRSEHCENERRGYAKAHVQTPPPNQAEA